MLKLIATLSMLTLMLQAAPPLKTGQTTTYAEFDDGHYQEGAVREYDSVTKPGVVIDVTMGLEWQDDYSDNGGSIKKADWQGAIDYCAGLGLDGGGWHLPTRKELVSLSDRGRVNPAIDPAFEIVASDYYWSSTTYAGNTSNAWAVYFNYGYQYNYTKDNSYYVRCVRAGQ